MGDTVFPEEISVGDGSVRAEPEVTEMLSGGREMDLVHRGAYRLDDFLRDVVETDHLLPRAVLLLHVPSSRASSLPLPLLPPSL